MQEKSMNEWNRRLRAGLWILDLLVNLWIFVITAAAVAGFFTRGGEGNMQAVGTRMFVYFTVDSNVLCALASLAVFCFRLLSGKGKALPKAVLLCKMAGTVAVTVTLLVVLFFLGPALGYPAMFVGANLHMHLLTPLLAILSFLFLDGEGSFRRTEALLGGLPVLLYGIVYFTQVILRGPGNGGWADFYGFNRGGLWPVSAVVVVGGSFLLSLGMRRLFLICRKRQ